jgi:hypothetical protein
VIAESGGWYFAQDLTNTLRFVIAAVPVESAAQRCEADMAAIFRLAGADLDELASYGYTVELQEFLQRHPIVVGRGTSTAGPGRLAVDEDAMIRWLGGWMEEIINNNIGATTIPLHWRCCSSA